MFTTFSPYDMDMENWPPLWAALLTGDERAAGKLLAEGAKLDDLIEADGNTFLHRAAQNGDLKLVHFFLNHGCPLSLESFDCLEHTPLIWASKNGHAEVVDYLLWKGADPNACLEARIGTTALIEAVKGGHAEVVKLLLEAGGDPSIKGWMQLTAHDHCESLIATPAGQAKGIQIQNLLAGALPKGGSSRNISQKR